MSKRYEAREISLDRFFANRDRVYVSTFELAPGFFQTIEYGPGVRENTVPQVQLTEEQATICHDTVLASYGYRKTGLRRWRFLRYLEFTGKGMVNVSRRPISRKSIWTMTAFWTLALVLAATGIVTSGGGWSIWTNLVIGSLDTYMLYHCVMGLLWVYHIPGRGRRRWM